MKDRILALDVGDRRIGIAVSNETGMIAQPVGKVVRIGWGPDIRRIGEFAAQYETKTLLCGMPRNMDGSYGPQAENVRMFARQLEGAGYTVVYWDERMTTITAERALIQGGVRRKDRKGIVDQTAAVIILQSYLDANA